MTAATDRLSNRGRLVLVVLLVANVVTLAWLAGGLLPNGGNVFAELEVVLPVTVEWAVNVARLLNAWPIVFALAALTLVSLASLGALDVARKPLVVATAASFLVTMLLCVSTSNALAGLSAAAS